MTKPEKIEEIRRACIAVNPEIVELKNGCQVISGKSRLKILIQDGKQALLVDMFSLQPVENSGAIIYDQILGRPIRLADVLLAIGKKSGIDVKWRHEKVIEIYMHWNLLRDSLEDQEEPTINLIHELIQK